MARHAERIGEMTNAYTILVRKHEEKGLSHNWEDNINMDLKRVGVTVWNDLSYSG